jgi:hypothetical protein
LLLAVPGLLSVTRLLPMTRLPSVSRLWAGLLAVTRLLAEATGLLPVGARLARLLGWDGHRLSLTKRMNVVSITW